jgi:hypothetical protein
MKPGGAIRSCLLDFGLTAIRRRNTGFFNQLHQLGHRSDTELAHHSATVNFHCLFRSTQLSGNLLVQHAGDDQLHHLKLAQRQ